MLKAVCQNTLLFHSHRKITVKQLFFCNFL